MYGKCFIANYKVLRMEGIDMDNGYQMKKGMI